MVQQCYIRRLGGDVVLLLLLLLPGLVLLSSSPDTQRVVVGNTTLHSEVCLYVYVYTWAKIYICVCVEHVHTYVCDWCAPGYIFQLQLETMYNSTRERERKWQQSLVPHAGGVRVVTMQQQACLMVSHILFPCFFVTRFTRHYCLLILCSVCVDTADL